MLLEILIGIISLVLSFNLLDNFRKWISSCPPGPWIFPLIGTLPQIVAKGKDSHIALDKLAKQYGGIMFVRLGTFDAVVLSSFESAKEICNMDCVTERVLNSFMATRAYPEQRDLGLIFGSGDLWKSSRRFILRNLRDFGYGKKQAMEDIILEQIKITTKKMDEDGKVNNNILDMSDGFPIPVLNMLWYFVAGQTFSHDDERCSRLIKIIRGITKSGDFAGGIGAAFPDIGNLFPEISGRNEWEERHRTLLDFVQELIDTYKTSKDPNEERSSLVDCLIYEESKNDPSFTMNNIKVILMDLLIAGAETTNNALSFGILYMIRFPEVQEKLRQELLKVFPGGIPCTLSLKDQLLYTQAVILEILRFANIVPLTPPRYGTEDIVYSGYKIKKNTGIIVNQYSILFDDKIWGDPQTFRPERYLTAEGKIDSKLAEKTVTFGLGKRLCPGQTLAESILFLFLTTLVQNYSLERVPNEPLPTLAPTTTFTLSPQPYRIQIRRILN